MTHRLRAPTVFHLQRIATVLVLFMALLWPTLASATANRMHLYVQWNDQPKAIETNITNSLQNLVNRVSRRKHTINPEVFQSKVRYRILDAMKPFGYFSAGVTLQTRRIGHRMIIQANISRNQPVRIIQSKLDIQQTGKPNQAFITLTKHDPLTVGKILNTQIYNTVKQRLYALSSSQGYFDAKMTTSKIVIDRDKHTASIRIVYIIGKRYRFNQMRITSDYLKKSFIRRFIRIKPGSYFNQSQINALQKALQNTHFFSNAVIETKTNAQNKTIDCNIELTSVKKQHYNFGAGYGSDTGPRATIGTLFAPLNRNGQSFSITSRLANDNILLRSSYNIPGGKPDKTQYSVFANMLKEEVPVGQSLSLSAGIQASHKFSRLKQLLRLYHLNETFNFSGKPNQHASMALASIAYSIQNQNYHLGADHYYLFSIAALGSKSGLASPLSFTQLTSHIQILKTFAHQWRVLLSNQIGYTFIKDNRELPLSLQLLAGGAHSFRGYDYKSIGPGKALFLGNIELSHLIKNGWFLGAFYDFGSVSNQLFTPMKQSAGPIVTKVTPIGGLSLSLAKPIDDHGKGWAIQFSLGQDL